MVGAAAVRAWLEWLVLRTLDVLAGLLLGAGALLQIVWYASVPTLTRKGVILVMQIALDVLTP